MSRADWLTDLDETERFFRTSTGCLEEADSGFRPTPEQMSAAQQVAHAGFVVDWFLDGAFSGGFDLDWERQARELAEVESLAEARGRLARAFDRARREVQTRGDAEWELPLPNDGIMDGKPRWAVIAAIADHTAHHRGALTVYSRLLGKTPTMPYA